MLTFIIGYVWLMHMYVWRMHVDGVLVHVDAHVYVHSACKCLGGCDCTLALLL